MQPTNQLQLTQPSLDLAICIDADTCASELKRCADEADRCVALTHAGAELAIRHAWNAGAICNHAKEIVPHGTFQEWLEANAGERGIRTLQRWMKLAKTSLVTFLSGNPKGLNDAYKLTGINPEAEREEGGESEQKDKPPFTLTFKTQWRATSEWSRDAAKDFLYEFDRLAQLARALKTEFGI
jgi:hypothetical protein